MKIMVVSDTHGYTDIVINEYKNQRDVNLVIHLGDYYKDAQKIEKLIDSEVIYVKGNTDGDGSEDLNKVFKVDNHNMYLTHGHKENVKAGLMPLYYKALSLSCNIALFGHTHIPFMEHHYDVLLFNPGSISIPKGGSQPSYGIINIENNNISAKIIYPNL